MGYASVKGELVKFTTRDGLVLDGFLHRSGSGNRKAIISVFGMTSNFFSPRRAEALCAASKGSGFDVFLPNNRGMGSVNSFHYVKGGKRAFMGTAMERFEDCVYDIDGAVRFMRTLGYNTIILQGHSTGCQKVVYYCSKKRDPMVKGIVLLAPDDDYNVARKELGKRFGSAVRTAREMVRRGHGGEMTPTWVSYYTARRFLSYADPKNAEARVFNYNSLMKEFGSIRLPILAVFGSRDEGAVLPVKRLLDILEEKTSSKSFGRLVIKGGDHVFWGKEDEVARDVIAWAKGLRI